MVSINHERNYIFNIMSRVYYHGSCVAATKFTASCIPETHSVVCQDLSSYANRAGMGADAGRYHLLSHKMFPFKMLFPGSNAILNKETQTIHFL